MSPDLMAFEELSNGKRIRYNGIDRNTRWTQLQDVIRVYAGFVNFNIEVNFEIRDVFAPNNGQQVDHNEIYNVAVLQFVISSILNTGGGGNQILDLFRGIVNSALSRWWNSNCKSPFLFILNDVDSMNKGRNYFHRLLDILEECGYHGVAYAQSSYEDGDLGRIRWSARSGQRGYGSFAYTYSSCTSNNSAALTIEVLK